MLAGAGGVEGRVVLGFLDAKLHCQAASRPPAPVPWRLRPRERGLAIWAGRSPGGEGAPDGAVQRVPSSRGWWQLELIASAAWLSPHRDGLGRCRAGIAVGSAGGIRLSAA